MNLTASHRLRLSDRAQAKIRSLGADDGRSVRLYAERRHDGSLELGLAFDERRDTDFELPADGVTVVADPQTVALFDNRILDYAVTGFTFARDGACESRPFTE